MPILHKFYNYFHTVLLIEIHVENMSGQEGVREQPFSMGQVNNHLISPL